MYVLILFRQRADVYTNGESRSSHQTREHSYRSWDRRQKSTPRYDPDTPPEDEPLPDYSPKSWHKVRSPGPASASPTPSALRPETPSDARRKHQKTRFDIPPQHAPPPPPEPEKTDRKSSIGESFRKIIGKFRSASKEKKRKDSFLGKLRGEGDKKGAYVTSEVIDDLPVAPPRPGRVARQSSRAAADYRRGSRESREMDSGADTPTGAPVVNRYYLGEDPFNGSIYGKEREYDGVTPHRSRSRSGQSHQHYRSVLRNLNFSSTFT